MNKRDLKTLVEVEEELRMANLKIFGAFNTIASKLMKFTKLVHKLKDKAVKDADSKSK